eukprot:3947508-Prymnesium_polylepis.1
MRVCGCDADALHRVEPADCVGPPAALAAHVQHVVVAQTVRLRARRTIAGGRRVHGAWRPQPLAPDQLRGRIVTAQAER